MFVHLHLHDEYSLLDGFCTIEEAVQKAKEMGHTALAITNHGVTSSHVIFAEACNKAGIKPILGCEVYTVPDRNIKERSVLASLGITSSHLILLPLNEVGYVNLLTIVSDAYLTGFYVKPRTDYEMLSKHSDGLIALSGCLEGEVAKLVLNDKYEEAIEKAKFYNDMFKGRYYLEIQANTLPQQEIINQHLTTISKETGIPLVATNDCHYVNQDDSFLQDISMCIAIGKKIDDPTRFRFSTNDFYMKSEEEMQEIVQNQEAIDNTQKIADQIEFILPVGVEPTLPKMEVPLGFDVDSWLKRTSIKNLMDYLAENPDLESQKYIDRIEYELEVICSKGYAGYFLIVSDFVHWAKENGIFIGPARGSAAGSLVSFMNRITKIDPLKYDLYFERRLRSLNSVNSVEFLRF